MTHPYWQWLLKAFYAEAKKVSVLKHYEQAQALIKWLADFRYQLPKRLHHFTMRAINDHVKSLTAIKPTNGTKSIPAIVYQVPHQQDLEAMNGAYAGLNEDQGMRLSTMKRCIMAHMNDDFVIDSHSYNHHTFEFAFPWQLICQAIREGNEHLALCLFDDIHQTPLKKALLHVHSISYIKEIIQTCSRLTPNQHIQFKQDLLINRLSFEVIINDLLSTINSDFAVIVNIGLPGHHATFSGGRGFCFINKNLVLSMDEYFRHQGQEPLSLLVLGIDVNQDNGTHEILNNIDMPMPSVHIDICDTRVYPYPGNISPIAINLAHQHTQEYLLIDLAKSRLELTSPAHPAQHKHIHPAIVTALLRALQQLEQAALLNQHVILNILLGFDSHQGEEAACGRMINANRWLREDERQEHRFSDEDFAFFYHELACMLTHYNNILHRTFIQIEGGYTPKIYQKQLQVMQEKLKICKHHIHLTH